MKLCPVLSIPRIKKHPDGCLHLHPMVRLLSLVPLGAPSNSPLPIPQQGLPLCSACQSRLMPRTAQGLAQWVLNTSKDGDANHALVHVPGLHLSHRGRFPWIHREFPVSGCVPWRSTQPHDSTAPQEPSPADFPLGFASSLPSFRVSSLPLGLSQAFRGLGHPRRGAARGPFTTGEMPLRRARKKVRRARQTVPTASPWQQGLQTDTQANGPRGLGASQPLHPSPKPSLTGLLWDLTPKHLPK